MSGSWPYITFYKSIYDMLIKKVYIFINPISFERIQYSGLVIITLSVLTICSYRGSTHYPHIYGERITNDHCTFSGNCVKYSLQLAEQLLDVD